MHKKAIGFIESNTTGSGKIFLEKALELGFEVIFLTQDPNRYPFLVNSKARVIVINTLDKEQLLEALKKISNLIGVFSTSEYYIEITALVAQALQLPGNQPTTIAACRNKRVFYEKLAESNFSIPKTWFITTLEELYQKQEEFTFPAIVKPVSGTGSIGVKQCLNFSQLYNHASELLSIGANERGLKNEKGLLVQTYIEGPEYSAEVVAYKGDYYLLGLTAKYTTDNQYFIETGHDFPALFKEEEQTFIWEILKGILKFINFTFGPAHIEFKFRDDRVTLIEVNPRLAGGMIPQLICYACQIDLYGMLIKLYAQEDLILPTLQYKGSSIRFFVAKENGTIVDIVDEKILKKRKDVVEVHFTKTIGDQVTIHNDFRDRVGCLITVGPDSLSSKKTADDALKHFYVHILAKEEPRLKGRLSDGPHPLIKQILRKPKNDSKWKEELEQIAQIDLAHLLMLFQSNILTYEQTAPIIQAIQDFQKNLASYFEQLDFSRGTYYAYERHLESILGVEIAGNNHIARSRNDINATLFYLLCRDSFLKVYKKVLLLSEALLNQAKVNQDVPLPIYSQHQPAMPGNYAFYLLAVNEPIKRLLEDLRGIGVALDTSPLGAGAGCGTDIPINPPYVANLLGFDNVFTNALDAIANRDFALRYKGILSNLCMTLSRIAQDYQLWTTQEFHFFELPDNLCGSSSMMPQKKNPYILEVIKSKTMDVISNLLGTFGKMHKVPTGNSIEVSSAAYDTIDFVTAECLDALDLLTLVIAYAQPVSENMIKASREGLTIATYITNQLMKQQSISFRKAHLTVGSMIQKSEKEQKDTFQCLSQYLHPKPLAEERVLETVVQDLNYGGGAWICLNF